MSVVRSTYPRRNIRFQRDVSIPPAPAQCTHTDPLSDSCKCAYNNLYITIHIKSPRPPFPSSSSRTKSGRKPIKTFRLTGANRLDEVLLWLWRELFVSLLAGSSSPSSSKKTSGGGRGSEGEGKEGEEGKAHEMQLVDAMLADIERVKGWRALERVLFGGRWCKSSLCLFGLCGVCGECRFLHLFVIRCFPSLLLFISVHRSFVARGPNGYYC
jgi:hypothetical protein